MDIFRSIQYILMIIQISCEQKGVVKKFVTFLTLLLCSIATSPRDIPAKNFFKKIAKNLTPYIGNLHINVNIYFIRRFEDLPVISNHRLYRKMFKRVWDYVSVRRGYTVVEVGSHIGGSTLYLAKSVGFGGLVVAVEPHPENFEILKKNIEINRLSNVLLKNVAIYDEETVIDFNLADTSRLHSAKLKFSNETIKVKAITLDKLVETLRVKPNLLIIDVVGAEIEALRSAVKTIKKFRPVIVCVVFNETRDKVLEYMKLMMYRYNYLYGSDRYGYYVFYPM